MRACLRGRRWAAAGRGAAQRLRLDMPKNVRRFIAPSPVHFRCRLGLGDERRTEDAPTHHSDERSPVHHSITWSARPSKDGGIVRFSAFAVFMLTTSSNFVGCSTGRSAGLAPLRILSTKYALRWCQPTMLVPYERRNPDSAW